MARKLKTYVTSLGFFDLVVAAPSMKAALEAWGAESNLFHQGFAREVDDPQIVKAAMAKPGLVLKRPVGSEKQFEEQADLPHLSGNETSRGSPRRAKKKRSAPAVDEKTTAKAAADFDREQRKRDRERQREEKAQAKVRARREKAVAKARSALEAAERDHAKRAAALESKREALDQQSQAEDARWEKTRKRLEAALQRARR